MRLKPISKYLGIALIIIVGSATLVGAYYIVSPEKRMSSLIYDQKQKTPEITNTEQEPEAETATTEQKDLGNGYRIMENFVYYDENFGYDNKSPYYDNGPKYKKVLFADPKTFVILDKNFAKDDNNVFCRGKNFGADSKSFVILDRPGFAKDKDRVYLYDRIIDADPNTFSFVGTFGLAKDKNRAYYYDTVIEADPNTFEIINLDKAGLNWQPIFVKDKSQVYYIETVNGFLYKIEGADPQSFKVLEKCACAEVYCDYYVGDKNFIYVNNTLQKDIDVASFEYFGEFWNKISMPGMNAIAKDKDKVYLGCGKAVEGADPETFILLRYGYAKDKNRAYYIWGPLKGADVNTFEPIKVSDEDLKIIFKIQDDSYYSAHLEDLQSFAKDKNYLYYDGEIIKDVNINLCTENGLSACLPMDWQEKLQ